MSWFYLRDWFAVHPNYERAFGMQHTGNVARPKAHSMERRKRVAAISASSVLTLFRFAASAERHAAARWRCRVAGPTARYREYVFIVVCALLSVVVTPTPLHAQEAARAVGGGAMWNEGGQKATGDSARQQNALWLDGRASRFAFAQEQTGGRELGGIVGTVTDINGNAVGGARVVLQGPIASDRQTVEANEEGLFEIHGVEPGIPYRVTVSAKGFEDWTSSTITLAAGQYEILNGIKLRIQEVRTTVTVSLQTQEEIAVQEVKTGELQRGFGIIPNFLEVYTPNPVPLTWKLKFKLAFKLARDPVTVTGAGLLAGADEVSGTPKYADGLQGFAERFGASYANQFTDTMIGDGLLPSVLHQDPRYFYQGTGTKKSRVLHVISSVFVTKGDSGGMEPNYSLLGGALASAAIANTYYPNPNRGVGLIFENFGINVAAHMSGRLLQEFVFRPPNRGTRGQREP
jgi:hypothetical protein